MQMKRHALRRLSLAICLGAGVLAWCAERAARPPRASRGRPSHALRHLRPGGGDEVSYVETDPGVVSSGYERRR
jgi:hypothetical protein